MIRFIPTARTAAFATLACVLLACPGTGASEENQWLLRVEQDWELVVAIPEQDTGSPQVTLQMNPGGPSNVCCLLLLNYGDQPFFAPGGVQPQIWKADENVAAQTDAAGLGVLGTADEKITLTLFMEVKDGKLNFGAKNIVSATWPSLANTTVSTSMTYNLPVLVNYKTSDTTSNTGITLGANRVASLKLKEVRKYDVYGNQTNENGKQLYPEPPSGDSGGGQQ